MKFILLILEYTLSSIAVFLFILKFEAYEVYALQYCIFLHPPLICIRRHRSLTLVL
jgi:hypothetical protein